MGILYRFAAVLLLSSVARSADQKPLQKIVIIYPARSGGSWPLYIAKEGGYYAKYGLDATLVFGVHPTGIAAITSGGALMASYSLDQAMQAGMKDGGFLVGGISASRGLFSLVAGKDVATVRDLRGRRIAVGQIGEASYVYAVALLAKFGLSARDVEWVPVGTDTGGRAAALASGRVDAAMLSAPYSFRLEDGGFRNLAGLENHRDILTSNCFLFRKDAVAKDPALIAAMIQAHAESVKRFYADKAYAVQVFQKYQPEVTRKEAERIYDLYVRSQIFERVPYVTAPAVRAVMAQQSDPRLAEQMRAFDWTRVIDNQYVDKLVRQGFFRKLYGPAIKATEQQKAKLALVK